MFVSSLGLAPYFNYRFCHPLGTPIKPSYPRKIDSANGTKKCVPFLAAAIRPGRAATHLQVENKSAFFDFAGQQKSAGLMVAKPTNRRSTFCIYFFLHLAAFRAEKGRRGGVTGILWSDPGFNVLLWLHKPRKYLFFRTQISGK